MWMFMTGENSSQDISAKRNRFFSTDRAGATSVDKDPGHRAQHSLSRTPLKHTGHASKVCRVAASVAWCYGSHRNSSAEDRRICGRDDDGDSMPDACDSTLRCQIRKRLLGADHGRRYRGVFGEPYTACRHREDETAKAHRPKEN
jgi:hypothetical protein